MRILIVGSGGREHALAWAVSASPLCTRLLCAPGNAGIAQVAECVDIAAEDVEGLTRFAAEASVDFVVIGPEAPLVAGLADRLEAAGIAAFGPGAAAARLEGSKAFTKDLCARHAIPTAAYKRVTHLAEAEAHIRAQGAPIVIKADGLAAGKGVTVARTVEDALAAAREALSGGRFGEAGAELVIEECMVGPEVSFFALVDGQTALPLATAQDHKRAFDGDQGPNTGGMGAFSPSPLVDDAMAARIMGEIVEPTIRAMAQEGCPFKGVLYAGLMLTGEGPKLVEYNIRFGDPECQALMMRLDSDLLPALIAAREGRLASASLAWKPEPALCVVMAAKGYPGSYAKGSPISGLDRAEAGGATVFHAGTKAGPDGAVLANGGRVLGVTATGADLTAARQAAYAAVDAIDWPDGFCRRDIGATAAP